MAKPKLRFPEFMDEWEEKTVGTIFEFTNGKAHEQCVDENGKYVIINSKFISTEGKIKKYTNDLICPLKKNDIVMVMSDVPNGRAMSKCFLIQEDDKYTLNQRICGLRTSQNSVFYIHQISRNKYYLKFDNGVSQTNLRKEDVLNCPVFETKDDEQQKIADFLSSVDDLIQTQEDKIAVLEEQKKGIIQKLFNREVRFKADDGSEYPEWEEKLIGDILKICHGKDYKHLSNGNIPVLGTGGVITFVNEYLCDWECVLIGRKGTIDKPQYMNTPFWSVDTLFYSKPERNQCVRFQYYLFETINWKVYDESTGVPSLSASTIEKISTLIPCLEEQQKIADCLSAYDEAVQIKKDKLEIWKEIKKGLLQQMFV